MPRSSLRQRACFLVLAAFLASLLYSGTALAAVPESAAAANAPARAQEVVSIAIQDILFRANEEQQGIESVKQLLGNTAQIEDMRAELAAIAGPVDAKLDSTSRAALRGLPVTRIESLARHYDFDDRRIQAWQAQARRSFQPYDEAAMRLAQSRVAWTATRVSAAAVQLAPVLSERVDAVLVQIDGAEALLAGVLKQEFELMQRASEVRARIASGRRQVAGLIEEADERLLRFDSPPLWRVTSLARSTDQVWDAVERGIRIERQFALDYNAAGGQNQRALRGLELLLLPLLLWLGMRSRKAMRGQGDAAAHALRRPIASWLLLSMLAVLVFEPNAPLLVQEIALVATVVPVLRLLPARVVHASGRWAYAAVGLFAMDRASVAVIADNGVYRWLLLALTILALLLAWRLLPYARRMSRAGRLRRWGPALRAANRFALLALAIAALCNLLGNVMLAETLTSGVIDSAYMAILLYAGAICCRDIVRALALHLPIARSRFAVRHAAELRAAVARLAVLATVLGWLVYSLDRFRVLRPVREALGTAMAFGIEIGEVSVHIGAALTLSVSAWLAFRAARVIRSVLREELPGQPGLGRGVGSSIASLSYYTVLVLGLLFALSAAGVKTGQLAIVFGALGVGVGFGLQNVVNNFVSGLVLMFERPIQPGDTVDAAGVSGTVREIRLRSTTIRTFDGADTVIPNGVLLNGNLSNWTMYDRSRRFEIPVGVAYDADPARVIAILNGVVRATEGVAAVPEPAVMMTGYGESALNFVVSIWTEDAGRWFGVRGALLAGILEALRGAGIAMPYNQLDVHLHTVSREAQDDAPG